MHLYIYPWENQIPLGTKGYMGPTFVNVISLASHSLHISGDTINIVYYTELKIEI